MNEPTAFLSYSHSDRGYAEKLGSDLRENGVKVWIDKYEIKPGDSLIRKIFSEGLAKSGFFLILLSVSSTQSKWVAEELDAAMVRKIEGVVRIIPIIKEACDVPLPLRSLLWVDMSKEYDEGIRTLVETIHGVHAKPPVGVAPDYVTDLKHSVGGLSRNASTVGFLFVSRPDDEIGFERSYSPKDIHALVTSFSDQEFNDAVDELESYGLVETMKVFGTAPYDFGSVTPTYALFLHFKDDGLGYDPEEDIKSVAAAVAAKDSLDGDSLREIVPLPPIRLNRAVSFLEDYGYIRVASFMGTAPYNFGELHATRHTRLFVQEQCR